MKPGATGGGLGGSGTKSSPGGASGGGSMGSPNSDKFIKPKTLMCYIW